MSNNGRNNKRGFLKNQFAGNKFMAGSTPSQMPRFPLLLSALRALGILGLPPYLFFAFPQPPRLIHNSTVTPFLAKLKFQLSHNLHGALGGLIGVNIVASIFY